AKQDRAAAQQYWQTHLQELTAPSRLELAKPAVVGSGMGELRVNLSTHTTQQLEQFARQQGLTQASILQGLYALLLARMSRLEEIV
ncbi:hypothetical protein ICN41_11260, partial [Polynucleobacter sp. 15G-AUS-farblos]|uniref:condensation domain-containing protein n=1 Tax=Polynucleobacter sp. 15G-AUS-farblos TaxID=2689094 RepID=UPI001C0AEB94